MSVGDLFLVVVRWAHLVAATAWIGGSLFYLLALRPALRSAPESGHHVNVAAATEFRAWVDTCIFGMLATGVILTFNRLTPGVVGVPYAATLAAKIALSVWMFVLARGRHRRHAFIEAQEGYPPATGLRRLARTFSGYNAIVILGIIVFLLADALKMLFENALEGI